ncbi:molybdenum cofactor biosynthesis protein MoaE [Candidatus Methylacidithermus pantelleriae]|nr:molybdenum cofactor biosynthesis protein MoaE [Candidatus Methylacidithermus pantelleriae]
MEISVRLTSHPLESWELSFPLDGSSGVVLVFYGVVRREEQNHWIEALHYEAYETMAKEELFRICQELGKRYPCQRVEVVHRVGKVPVGEASLGIRVFARHRSEALGLLTELVDRLKERVPIWKAPCTINNS